MQPIPVVRLQWGHPLRTPEGDEIRVPKSAYPRLRQLGVLRVIRGKTPSLKPSIYQLLDPAYDTLTDGLRHLLGSDCSGPSWCVCHCAECREKRAPKVVTQIKPVRRAMEVKAPRMARPIDPRLVEKRLKRLAMR